MEDRLERTAAKLKELKDRRACLEEELRWTLDRRSELRSWCAEVDEVTADSHPATPDTGPREDPSEREPQD